MAVLLASGAIGFFLGMVYDPALQDALEPAQVVGGVVQYPPQNPVYLYSTRTWTVLHQVPAQFLRWGFSEHTLGLLLNGVVGMVSLQALGVFVLAFSRHVWLAIISPFFIYFTDATAGGTTYPVFLMGVPYTYGVVGLSFMVLTIALIGAGQARWGALLLGFGPAIHPTIGAWAIVIMIIAVVTSPRSARDHARRAWPYFLAGVAASALSLAVHYLSLSTDQTALAPSMSAFGQHWDDHRQPFRLISGSIATLGASTGLAVLWMSRFRGEIPTHARGLLHILIVAAVLGSALSTSYWLVPDTVPSVIPWAMPSRLLNLSLFTCTALVIGLSARYTSNAWIQLNLAALVLGVLIWCLSPAVAEEDRHRIARIGTAVSCLTLALLAELHRRGVGPSDGRPRLVAWLRRGPWLVVASVLVATGAFAVRDFGETVSQALQDWTSDPLLAAAAGRPGLVLTAGDLHQIQLRTRRPVLLDGGALDTMLYVPEAVPETERILRRVYGIDLIDLQRSHSGLLSAEQPQALWEARTPAEWRSIGREFGVTDVLTYQGWRLQLPTIASSAELILYEIPSTDPDPDVYRPPATAH